MLTDIQTNATCIYIDSRSGSGGISINKLQVCLEHTSWCSDDHICLKPLGRMAVASCTHSHGNNTSTVCSALHYLGRIPLSTKTVLWSWELDEGRALFIEKISKVILHASCSEIQCTFLIFTLGIRRYYNAFMIDNKKDRSVHLYYITKLM